MKRLPRTAENHHLLFSGSTWESQRETRILRRKSQLILPMDKDIEEELHKEVTTVPLLDQYTARHTLREFEPTSTYIGSIKRLIEAIDIGSSHPRTQPLERQLAELTIHAIELQLPYIRAGLLTNEVGHGKSQMVR